MFAYCGTKDSMLVHASHTPHTNSSTYVRASWVPLVNVKVVCGIVIITLDSDDRNLNVPHEPRPPSTVANDIEHGIRWRNAWQPWCHDDVDGLKKRERAARDWRYGDPADTHAATSEGWHTTKSGCSLTGRPDKLLSLFLLHWDGSVAIT